MGREPQGENHTYLTEPLKSGYLWPHHIRMVRLFAEGLTPGEVASLTGFTEGQITRIQATPHFQAELARLLDRAEEAAVDVREELYHMAPRAVEILDEDLNMEIHDLKARKHRSEVARDILTRAGIGGKSPLPAGGIHFHKHTHEAKQLSTEELRDEVMDLTRSEDGRYETDSD